MNQLHIVALEKQAAQEPIEKNGASSWDSIEKRVFVRMVE